MATEKYSALLPEVLIHAPGRLDEVAVRAIRYTVVDLCTRAQIWQMDYVGEIPAMETEPEGWTFRRFDLPDTSTLGGLVVDVRWLRVRGRTLKARPLRGIDHNRSNRDSSPFEGDVERRTIGDPLYFAVDLPPGAANQIILFPFLLNAEAERYEARLSLKPRLTGTMDQLASVPTLNLIEDYRETIVKGAVARLLQEGDASDYDKAQAHRSAYEAMLEQAAGRARGRIAGSSGTVRYGGIGSATDASPYRRRRW